MAITIPIGLSVGEDDVPTYNNYLYYQRKQLTAYASFVVLICSMFYISSSKHTGVG